jgi:dephospho-CoA kinase
MGTKKIVIGILGGIGSGKSSVAQEFARLGCGVIEADSMVRQLLEDKNIVQTITEAFGTDILSNAKVDRIKLSEKVFQDSESVERINKIIHPHVLLKTEMLIEELNNSEKVKAIVLDIPLLAEVGWIKRCDKIVFVDCKYQIRAQRTLKKGGFSEKQLKKRENFQISLDKKAKIADYILDNNSCLSALAEQVFRIFSIEIDRKE